MLIEAAHFDPPSVMFTAKRHDLRTEASSRFERGVDPNLPGRAAARAAALMVEFAGGQAVTGVQDNYPAVIEPWTVELPLQEIPRLLGIELDRDTVVELLARIGFESSGQNPLTVTVPTFRPDVRRPADLVEEVARIHGYDKIPETLPVGTGGGLTDEQVNERRLRGLLTGLGYSEAQSWSFVGAADLENLGLAEDDLRRRAIAVRNPLRDLEPLLRTTLLPGLLKAARFNTSHGADRVALFEIGKVFLAEPSPLDTRLPHQPDRLAFLAFGEFGPPGVKSDQAAADVYIATATWRVVAETLGIPDTSLRQASPSGFHPGRAADVLVGGVVIGSVGELHPAVVRSYGLEGRVAAGELALEPLVAHRTWWAFREPSTYPPVVFDLAFDLDKAVPSRALVEKVRDGAGEWLESVRVFDEFTGPSLGEGRKSIAVQLWFRAPDHTLTNEEVAPHRDRIVKASRTALTLISVEGRDHGSLAYRRSRSRTTCRHSFPGGGRKGCTTRSGRATGRQARWPLLHEAVDPDASIDRDRQSLTWEPIRWSSANRKSGWVSGKQTEDVARVLDRYLDVLAMRVFDHDDLVAVAANADAPVINLLSDEEHPCQALADLQTIAETRPLAGTTLAYLGDGNNVCHSLMVGAAMSGMTVRVATPQGYEPQREYLEAARLHGDVMVTDNPIEAVQGAHVVYTDVWASMGQEEEAEARARRFYPFQVNGPLFAMADPEAIFLHCLPAHRGDEVTDEVMDHARFAGVRPVREPYAQLQRSPRLPFRVTLPAALEGHVEKAARSILGMRLRTEIKDRVTELLLTEVEAYGGSDDAASHAYRGPTDRNRSMFGPPGTLYVYRSYGVHWCANVTIGPEGTGRAVLLRAGVPLEGEAVMQQRRGRRDHIADGPGKLAQAMGIDGSHDGSSLIDGPVLLLPRLGEAPSIVATPRVGIAKARERAWRFVLVR